MSYITTLISKVGEVDPALAKELGTEVNKISDRREFGLNFERHIPECVELPGRVVVGATRLAFGSRRTTLMRRSGTLPA